MAKVDFKGLAKKRTSSGERTPRDYFGLLTEKEKRLNYARDVQSEVWDKWNSQKNSPDLVIKMNTGSGKTVVGLVILYTQMKERRHKSVYVVPDKYLLGQVQKEAEALKIPTTTDPRSYQYQRAEAILIINIYTLVNGQSKFGVGDKGIEISIDSVLIDDAHSCLKTINDQFTISIEKSDSNYDVIYKLFKDDIAHQNEQKVLEFEVEDPTAYAMVPYWAWHREATNISRIFISATEEKYIFKWPLLKSVLKLCQCSISSSKIEISPRIIPIDIIGAIPAAKNRIYMTATLSDDSILTTHLGLDLDSLPPPITPDLANDIGDRIIIAPQALNPSLTREEIIEYCSRRAKKVNVLAILPSKSMLHDWQKVANEVCDKDSIEKIVSKMKLGHVGLVVIINRYDGIDLPESACRLLIIDGVPESRKLSEKITRNMLNDVTAMNRQVIQKIEQGMGRGIRSNDDFCAVILMDRNLTNYLYGNNGIEDFSPGTKAQIEYSNDVAMAYKDPTMKEIGELLDFCILQDKEWLEGSRENLLSLSYGSSYEIDEMTKHYFNAFQQCRIDNYQDAFRILDSLANAEDKPAIKGFAKFLAAEIQDFVDAAQSQNTLNFARKFNPRVIKPISRITIDKLSKPLKAQALAALEFYRSFSSKTKYQMYYEAVLSDLEFQPNSSNKFEEAMKKVAELIGMSAQRPENEFGKGPDVLWADKNHGYFVIECKNEAVAETISKTYCNQLNGSLVWFKTNYPSETRFIGIQVHPSTSYEYAASPEPNIRVMNIKLLSEFKNAVRNFARTSFCNDKAYNETEIKEQLEFWHLSYDLISPKYTVRHSLEKRR
jgi:hypothetical protein